MIRLLIFLQLSFLSLPAVELKVSSSPFKAGDIIRVSIRKEAGDKFVKVYENGKERTLYRDKSKPPVRGLYHFFTGHDIQNHVSRVAFKVVTAKRTFTRIFEVEKIHRSSKPKGKIEFRSEKKKNLLKRDRSFVQAENLFFHRYFKKETRVQYWRDRWQSPIPSARVSSPYGRLRTYPNGRTAYHRGVDFAAPEGTQVLAANHGVVVFSGEKTIRGRLVVINHGCGLYTSYWHLKKCLVQTGERVKKGQIIGEVGKTGLATGAHLHWDVRVRSIPVDGLRLLSLDEDSKDASSRPEN